MNDFVQMDIFFFIASVASIVFLLFIIVIGLYVFSIVKKVRVIAQELQDFALYATSEGKKSLADLQDKIEDILNSGGVAERIIVTTLGTIIAKTFKNRAKIKKDARKK